LFLLGIFSCSLRVRCATFERQVELGAFRRRDAHDFDGAATAAGWFDKSGSKWFQSTRPVWAATATQVEQVADLGVLPNERALYIWQAYRSHLDIVHQLSERIIDLFEECVAQLA